MNAGAPRGQQGGDAQYGALQREQVDQGDDPALRQHGEGQEQQQRRERVQDLQIDRQRLHAHAPSNSRTNNPSTANRKAVARNSGAAKTRNFADTVSISANPPPAMGSFTPSNTTASAKFTGAWLVAMPQGTKTAKPMQA